MSEVGYMVVEIDYIGVRSGIYGSGDGLYWCEKWDIW